MSQNDYIIANQSAPDFRSDLNDALQALASLSSGSTAPSTTYANMLWYDDANNILKMRSEADDAWINVGYLDQSANAFRILDDTQVVNTSGTQVGLLGDQTEATWIQGTSTTEGLVSPAKVKAAIEAASPVKAWVNFDGTGTVSIREDLNVSSITDNGTGDYTVNFTSALTDTNFSVVASIAGSSPTRQATIHSSGSFGVGTKTTSSVRVITGASSTGGSFDAADVNVIVVR